MNEYRSAAILKRAQNLLILHRAYKLLAADAEWRVCGLKKGKAVNSN